MGVGNTQITKIVNKALFNAFAKSCSDSYSGRQFSTGGGGWKTPTMLDKKNPVGLGLTSSSRLFQSFGPRKDIALCPLLAFRKGIERSVSVFLKTNQ